MSDARLTSAMLVSALVKRANRLGGTATVLAKGDPTSGVILIQALEKGLFAGVYERQPTPAGRYEWGRSGPQDIENEQELSEYFARRRSRDPDLWIVELDIADSERFIVETLGIS